jgi:hypothetical protein
MRIPDTTRIIGDLVFSGCPNFGEHYDGGIPAHHRKRRIMPYAFKGVTVQHASGPPKLFRQLALSYESKPRSQIENFFWSIKRHKENNLAPEARNIVFTVYYCFKKFNVAPEMAMCVLQMLTVSTLAGL